MKDKGIVHIFDAFSNNSGLFLLTVESNITIIGGAVEMTKSFLKTVQKKCRRKAAMQVESRRKVFFLYRFWPAEND